MNCIAHAFLRHRTWYHFVNINASEPFWLARLPMTKVSARAGSFMKFVLSLNFKQSAVRAMDTITDYIYKKNGNNITEFIVAGASKRGWTTWTTGAVDSRVIAIIPVVMGAALMFMMWCSVMDSCGCTAQMH